MLRRSDKGLSMEEAISSFKKEIARQEDIIYGAALFFECLSLLHADQGAVIETHRKHFRNIIQKGREMTERATRLLEEVREDGRKIEQIKQFKFHACEGHPNPQEMEKRAGILVETYVRIFSGRPRDREFTSQETLRLIEEASAAF